MAARIFEHVAIAQEVAKTQYEPCGPNVEGDLVLIKESSPALTWKTACVVSVFPGEDGVTRVADVRLATETVLRRPAVRLCPLPLLD